MSPDRPIPRYLGVVVLLAMTAFAAVGFLTIRKDVEALQKISQDNFLWSATQVEVAMLRFELSVARMALDQTEQSLAEVQERFDIYNICSSKIDGIRFCRNRLHKFESF